MIGRITGQVLEKSLGFVLVDVSGVGYEIEIPHSTFDQLQETDHTVTLHTHLIVREDAQLLYGFYTERERELFRTLIKVNKVGPKVAIAILSSVETDAFVRCIREKDVKTLNAIPSVGKVMAERLIVEMSNKLEQWETELPVTVGRQVSRDLIADVESALVGLGFKPAEASRAIAQLEDPGDDVELMIKQALRVLA